MLECDFCGAKYDVAQIEAMYAEKEAAAVAATEKAEEKAEANRQKLADMERENRKAAATLLGIPFPPSSNS